MSPRRASSASACSARSASVRCRPVQGRRNQRQLEGFLDYLQAECGLSNNTRQGYRRDLERFLEHLESSSVRVPQDITSGDISDFLVSAARRGLSASSVARALAAVKTFCKYLVITGVMRTDVSADIDSPKKWTRLPTVLEHSTVRSLIDSPDPRQDKHAVRDRAILTLLYATGMRASELVNLRVGDVNSNLGVVRVLGKGRKERIIPLATEALDAVGRYRRDGRAAVAGDENPRRALFLSRSGRELAREDVYRIVTKYVRRASIAARVSPHTLRHCFATAMLARGADMRSVQEMLGHADISTTQVYTHVDADRLKAVHAKYHPRG